MDNYVSALADILADISKKGSLFAGYLWAVVVSFLLPGLSPDSSKNKKPIKS